MRVLVGCEFSGTVRDAFIELGHDAVSCDLLPCERGGPHLQCDVLDVLGDGWDLAIFHPPCTHLAVSGASYFKVKAELQEEALGFVRKLLNAPIPQIALENPVSVISSRIRKPDQIIQPWMFGEDGSKSTCLWLKNLPLLVPTRVVKAPRYSCCGKLFDASLGPRGCPVCCGVHEALPRYSNQSPGGQDKTGPSPDRWKERSKTYPGIAKAMAAQWSNVPVLTLF